MNCWDVSDVTNMLKGFDGFKQTGFNERLDCWNTSKVTNMYDLFARATVFNQDISAWDTSSVTSMRHMFWYASSFNQNLCDWNVDASDIDDTTVGYSGCPYNKNAPVPGNNMCQDCTSRRRLEKDAN